VRRFGLLLYIIVYLILNLNLKVANEMALQIGLISALSGGIIAAAVLQRIRLTRFLIIAALSILAVVARGGKARLDIPRRPLGSTFATPHRRGDCALSRQTDELREWRV
jgi:hypothetical protein